MTSPSQIKNDQPRKAFLEFGITGDASFHPGVVTCDVLNDDPVPVLHVSCICIHRFTVLHELVMIMCSCTMGLSLATASAAVVCSVYSKWGFIIALSVISN